jgi:hypothetical protein
MFSTVCRITEMNPSTKGLPQIDQAGRPTVRDIHLRRELEGPSRTSVPRLTRKYCHLVDFNGIMPVERAERNFRR